MRNLLIDDKDSVIYEGKDSKDLLLVLTKDPADVTEVEEILYENQLRNLEWYGQLRNEKHFDIKFMGIDDWSRPIFRDIDTVLHFCSVNTLFSIQDNKEKIIEYFKNNIEELEYYGTKFNTEPHGGRSDNWKFNFIDTL